MATTQTALITGASTGIGAVYADRLARRGHNLVLVARSGEKLAVLAAELHSKYGVQVETMSADLANAAQLARVARRLADDAKITMLVNNAGLGATAKLAESDIDQMDAMIDINVKALTRLTHAVAPRFGNAGSGTIINIASIVAVAPEVLNGVYGGSKAFVLALTQSLHHELGAKGVRVQAVLPGAIETPFWDKAGVPVQHLPNQIVMKVDDLVDAALSGFDQGEVVTIPSLPDAGEWERFNAARLAMGPNLSRNEPAARYRA
ncbi:SDR family NAD(P)-dependent oxidoreductase [Pseudoduganella sp. UC29_106]|uniref:SDR family NAD(P)-dependent oxidoreductase n=1 Tax=Pseudoduganella sp. UC29_106 TaxID=3374553 RepID=UPI0037578F17